MAQHMENQDQEGIPYDKQVSFPECNVLQSFLYKASLNWDPTNETPQPFIPLFIVYQ